MSSTLRLSLIVCALGLAGASPSAAQSAPAAPSGWQFQITPYLWATGLDGEIRIGNLPAGDVDASFSDIWSDLHFALMGAFEARRGRWGILVDAFYADLSAGTHTPGPIIDDVKVDVVEQFYTALGSYRVHEGPVAVDVVFGPRYSNIDADLTLTSGSGAGRTGSAAIDWWDAIGGTRVAWQSQKGWFVSGYADVGGSGDNVTWEVLAAGGYRFKKLTTLSFGYRYLSVDYDDGTIVYDVAMAGPFLGVGFRF